ncbi:MAG: Ig-like domain-containing protein, partial [Cyclobacteriaceae bacterium]
SNSNGTATFELTLSDLVLSSDGLLPDRTSAPQVFTITVNAVNDVPTFTIEGNPGASDEDAGLQTVTGFASAINPGGGSDESTQALTFSLTQISASGTLVFSSAPVISSTGVLTYEAAANTNGSATFNVTLTDNGSPVGTSPIQTFTITVFGVNDVPSFTLAADPAATNEDAVLQTVARFVTDISPGGGADESSQPLRFNLTPISTTGNLTFSSAPSVSAAGELTYQAETNTNGTATFELTLSDLVLSSDGLLPDRTSASQALTITVNAVNDVPTFTIAGNPGASDEDAGLQTVSGFATAISAGGGSDETTQVLTFGLTETASTGTLTFSTAPAISSDGELTFQAAPNTNGTATFEVTLSDDGSPVATSGVQAFTITVNAVNDVPSFTINDDPNATEEDAGVQTLGEFANAISPGGGIDESGQSLTFSLTETAASGTLAFSIAPAISSAGELTYQAAPNTNGIATFDVMLIDDGSPVQTSGIQSFTITINAVNDVPSFTINNDPNATNEDAGLQTFGEFANAISAGGGIDESGQSLTFSLNETASTGTLTFSSAPALSSTGELTYQAAPNTNGTATFDVNLSDDGSPVATSGAQAFTITINAVNDEPSFTINDDPSATEEDAGLQIFGEFANAISAGGGIDESGQSLTFSLTETATTGTLAFSNSPTISSAGELTFQAAPNTNGTTTFDVTLSDDGSPVATSGVQSFTITVGDVNDPPSFIISRNPAQVEEDAGRQRVSGFASAISAGAGADESSQTLTFSVRTRGTTGDLAFESLPSISRSGELSFEPSPNTNGTATFDVALSDGLTSTSAQSFTIAVNPVNDMPEFTIAANPDPIAEDSEAQIIADYVTGISAGGGTDEEDQALSFTVNSVSITGTLAFSSAPAISPAGELTYTPLPNTSGIATFEIKLSDGFATTAPQSMTITVDAVNDTPEFILAENGVAIAEDSGAQKIVNFATAISAGDEAEDSVQVVTFNISNITTTGSLAFSSVPVISPSGELTFTTAANTNGTATFDVTLSDDGTSMATSNAQSTTITVGAVNDTPNFELMTNPDQSVAQNSTAILVSDFATNITPGDGEDEAQQALTFETLNDNNLLFSVQPAIDARSGSLTYTIAPNVTGVATVSTRLSDDSDGANTSPIQTFQITVNAQNNAPTFTKGADVAVSEDAGQVQIDNWATNISDGDDGSQVLTFQIADNSNPGLFSVAPALSTNGTLTFTLAENEFGLAEISVLLTDDASVNAQSSVSIFSIIVDPVNDAPVIKAPSDLTEDAGSTQAIGLTGIGTGATNEQQQMVITVTTDRPDLITNIGVDYLSPSEEGTLTFDIIGNSDAVATITVTITDVPSDGESALETVYTFAVQINRVVDNTIFLPSLFSPNSDGQNDRFVLRGNGIADITLSIQDTEGFEVYRTDNVMGATQDGWDGNYSNGSRAHSDSYIWVLRGSFSDGSPLSINGKRTGIVRLIR